MEPFSQHTGVMAPLDRANVDTDAIIPKQFLRKIERTGFGQHLFHEWRYLDYEGTRENPDFVLNRAEYRSATILLARDNFGCGSSREHAVWAIQGAKVGAVIAHSFARIFYRNCINCGFYPIELHGALEKINDGDELEIDYKSGTIDNKTQGTKIEFTPLPDFALEIVNDGGLLNHIKKQK